MAVHTHEQLELPLMVEDSTQLERAARGCTIIEAVATASAAGACEARLCCRVATPEHSMPDLNEAA